MSSKIIHFKVHMQQKIEVWHPYNANLGEDFCVFEFDTDAERNDAIINLAHYASYYGYTYEPGPNETLLIVDTKDREVVE